MAQEETKPTLNVSAKSVAKYALLPGILPRLQRLALHLSQFLFIFTQIFGSVGLIDKNHPCLRPENIGRYRFTDILGLAASNVIFDRKHLPQIVMFFMVVLSIVLTAAILLGLIASTIFTVHTAQAQLFGMPEGFKPGNGAPDVTYIGTSGDWALNFLFRIFGNTGFFPQPSDGAVGNPWFTAILVGMLKYYSLAMLVVASFMILYILVITLTEAAKSGQPFGTKFDSIWAPIRLALAIGMLMPISHGGYNGAQMMVFQSALWGSNLATNVWYGGLSEMSKNSKNFFGTMMGDPGYKFIRDMFVVNLCVAGLKAQADHDDNISKTMQYSTVMNNGKIAFSFGTDDAPDFCGQVEIKTVAEQVTPSGVTDTIFKTDSWPDRVVVGYYNIAKKFIPLPNKLAFGVANMTYTPGTALTTGLAVATGGLSLLVTDVHHHSTGVPKVDETLMGPAVNYAVLNLIDQDKDKQTGKGYIDIMNPAGYNATTIQSWVHEYWKELGVMYNCSSDTPPYTADSADKCGSGTPYRSLFFESPYYKESINDYNKWIITRMTSDSQYGWTTAGVFYLRIASAMASISEIVSNAPRVTKMPANFTKAFATTDNLSANTELTKTFCSSFADKYLWWSSDACDKYHAAVAMNTFLRGGKDWFMSAVQADSKVHSEFGVDEFDHALELNEPDTAENMDVGNITGPVLGGLAGMAKIDSGDMNPLGTVISWGNLMLTISMVSFVIGMAGKGAGWTDMAFDIGTVLLIPGFVLAFWVPTIPFMHFTFAVIEWMISILEAVIGMPLWALSLITLEGDGLGRLGMSGIKRLFEIILRPTIIIMALVASIIIFTAGVTFFNSALGLYQDAQVANRNVLTAPVSSIGMLFVYMFGIYTLATSCFKLIDAIPDNFGRWFGLEKGFGGSIKTGFSELSGLIVGGAALNQLNQMSGTVNKQNQAKAAKLAAEKAKNTEKNS